MQFYWGLDLRMDELTTQLRNEQKPLDKLSLTILVHTATYTYEIPGPRTSLT